MSAQHVLLNLPLEGRSIAYGTGPNPLPLRERVDRAAVRVRGVGTAMPVPLSLSLSRKGRGDEYGWRRLRSVGREEVAKCDSPAHKGGEGARREAGHG